MNTKKFLSDCYNDIPEKSITIFKEYIIEQILNESENDIQIINRLQGIYNDLINLIYSNKSKFDLQRYEFYLDTLLSIFNDCNIKNNFIKGKISVGYYPEIGDINFLSNISNNSIFKQYQYPDMTGQLNNLILGRTDEKKIITNDFKLSNSQAFVSSYLSYNTPYKGLLLFHGVGVGKTCAALSIVNENINHYNQRVLIITPNNKLWDSWKDEIFNINKEKNKYLYNIFISNNNFNISFSDWISYNNKFKKQDKIKDFIQFLEKQTKSKKNTYLPIKNIQCLNNSIDGLLFDGKNDKINKKLVNEYINSKFEFMTYTKLVNKFLNWQYEKKTLYLIKINNSLKKGLTGIQKVKIKRKSGSKKKNKELFFDYYNQYKVINEKKKTKCKSIKEIEKDIRLSGLAISEFIQDTYSNRIIIMDEAHKVRNIESDEVNEETNKDEKIKKLKIELLYKISRYAYNKLLVICTATPMQSDSDEIVDIINLLLLNNHKPPLIKQDIFDKNDNLKESGLSKFIQNIKGYISYVKGENPTVFPIKLIPHKNLINNDSLLPSLDECPYIPRPLITMITKDNSNILTKNNWIKNFYLMRGEMSNYQRDIWLSLYRLGEFFGKKKNKYIINIYGLVNDIDIISNLTICLEKYMKSKITIIRSKKIDLSYTIEFTSSINLDTLTNTKLKDLFIKEYPIYNTIDLYIDLKNKYWNWGGFLGSKSIFHSCIISFPTQNVNYSEIMDIQRQIKNGEEVSDDDIIKCKTKLRNCISLDGFKNCLQKVVVENKTKYIINSFCETFLDLEHQDGIKKYSSKLYNILRLIENSNGIVFIYSTFIKDSIDILKLLLERNGFKEFHQSQKWNSETLSWNSEEDTDWLTKEQLPNNDNKRNYEGILFKDISDKKKKIQGRFIICKSGFNFNNLREVRGELGEPNKNGEHIKIVLGSPAFQVGYSLFRVRQLHIIEPWYHFNITDQIIGRGIRTKSHQMLNYEERNIMIFLHSASLPFLTDKNIDEQVENISDIIDLKSAKRLFDVNKEYKVTLLETTDEYQYRHSYTKSVKMSKVNRLLIKYAVDCPMNKTINDLSLKKLENVKPFNLITFQKKNIPNFKIGDVDGSWSCNFTNCDYHCDNDIVFQGNIEFNLRDKDIELYKFYNLVVRTFLLETINNILGIHLSELVINSIIKKENIVYLDYDIVLLLTNNLDEIKNKIEKIDTSDLVHKFNEKMSRRDIKFIKFSELIPKKRVIKKDEILIDIDNNKILLETIENKLKDIFLQNFSITLEEIKNKLLEFDNIFIYQVLHNLIIKKKIIFDPYLQKSYLVYKKIGDYFYYLTQPILNSSYKIYPKNSIIHQDENISISERIIPPSNLDIKSDTLLDNYIPLKIREISGEKLSLHKKVNKDFSNYLDVVNKIYILTQKYLFINKIEKLYPFFVKYPRVFGGFKLSRDEIFFPPFASDNNYEDTIPIPTKLDLYLMSGFSIIDNLSEEYQNVLLEWTFKKAINRVLKIRKNPGLIHELEKDLWEKPYIGIKIDIPSIENICYFYFIGDKPENIQPETPGIFKINDLVKITKGKYATGDDNYGIIKSIEIGDCYLDLYKKCTKKQVNIKISLDSVSHLNDNRNQISFQYFKKNRNTYKLSGKNITQDDIYLPFLIRTTTMTGDKGKQLFKNINEIVIEKDNEIEYEFVETEKSIIYHYRLRDYFIKPPPTSLYYTVMGYTSITGSCDNLNENLNNIKSTSKEDIINFVNIDTLDNILLFCFFILECGGGKSNKKGNKLISQNKNYKIPLINNIFGCIDKNPYTAIVKKYVDSAPFTLLVGNSSAFHRINEFKLGESKEYFNIFSQLNSIQVIKSEEKKRTVGEINNSNKKKGLPSTHFGFSRSGEGEKGFSKILTSKSLTFEIMLLLRFYRFIGKGKTNHIFTKWFIRKSEMYIWLKNENNPLNNIITELDKTECGS